MKMSDIKIGESYAVSSAGGGPRGMGYIDFTLPPVMATVTEIVDSTKKISHGWSSMPVDKIVKKVRCQIIWPVEYRSRMLPSVFDLEPRHLTGPWTDAQAAYLADRDAKAPADNAALRLRGALVRVTGADPTDIDCDSVHRNAHTVHVRLTVEQAERLADVLTREVR